MCAPVPPAAGRPATSRGGITPTASETPWFASSNFEGAPASAAKASTKPGTVVPGAGPPGSTTPPALNSTAPGVGTGGVGGQAVTGTPAGAIDYGRYRGMTPQQVMGAHPGGLPIGFDWTKYNAVQPAGTPDATAAPALPQYGGVPVSQGGYDPVAAQRAGMSADAATQALYRQRVLQGVNSGGSYSNDDFLRSGMSQEELNAAIRGRGSAAPANLSAADVTALQAASRAAAAADPRRAAYANFAALYGSSPGGTGLPTSAPGASSTAPGANTPAADPSATTQTTPGATTDDTVPATTPAAGILAAQSNPNAVPKAVLDPALTAPMAKTYIPKLMPGQSAPLGPAQAVANALMRRYNPKLWE